MKITAKIEGFAEIARLLRELGPQLAAKVGDRAVRRAAKPLVDEMKRLVPVDTGALRRSLAAAANRRNKRQSRRGVRIGARRPESRIAHLVEFGTSHSAAKPFMRPALDSQGNVVIMALREELAKGLAEEATKFANKYRTKRRR
jgi:HK97 gp10 family phage protein